MDIKFGILPKNPALLKFPLNGDEFWFDENFDLWVDEHGNPWQIPD